MNKKIFFFLFLFLICPKSGWADSSSQVQELCANNPNQLNLINLDQLKIKNIEVKIFKDRRWKKNSLRIFIGNFRFIPDKYKKWLKANIIVNYENDLICIFKAKVKFHGDQKDHLILKGNSIAQSLDVHLRSGNIHGITKFILLLDHTRGKLEDVIFVSELLRQFNYLAPRTMHIDTAVNGVSSKMIFQEKAVKELLEYHLRREGPILEGDERYLWRLAQKVPSNQLSNHAAGLVPEIKAGFNAMLAKQNNTNIIPKSKKHAQMSFNALSNLNVAYLLYSNMYNSSKTNYYESYRYYTLNNNLLGFHEPENILKLDIYNLIIQSATGYHGLVPNNRKFYWNSIENYFEPINYDSKFNIDSEPEHLLLPFTESIMLAFSNLEKLLNNVNIENLVQQINYRGVKINNIQAREKINKLKKNLNKLKDIYINYDKKIINHNNVYKINSQMWDKYVKSIKKINPEVVLVKQNEKNNFYQSCIDLKNCNKRNFSEKQVSELLDGDLIINDIEYQYLGKNTNVNDLLISSKYNKIQFQNTYFYYDKNIEFKKNLEKNEFNIFQKKPGARAFFYKGNLNDININFYGFDYEINEQPINFPMDEKGLTGCLSLVYLNVENVNIKFNNSSCEDAVNIIGVKGTFNDIDVKNSFSDGLDVDFSDIFVNSINVSSSINDCVDFSGGNYKLNKLNLRDCGDKALSVGEKSLLALEEIVAENSNIGIASKDSSVSKLKYASFKNTKTCLSAYNKKQEFLGGLIEVKKLKCENYYKKTDSDFISKIIIE
jgi:hypothetical protein